jgi:hypothetical protein
MTVGRIMCHLIGNCLLQLPQVTLDLLFPEMPRKMVGELWVPGLTLEKLSFGT